MQASAALSVKDPIVKEGNSKDVSNTLEADEPRGINQEFDRISTTKPQTLPQLQAFTLAIIHWGQGAVHLNPEALGLSAN